MKMVGGAMSEKKDYFDYVENVLGVKSILLEHQHDHEEDQKLKVSPLLILVDNYLGYTVDENELLAKMIAALKIESELIRVFQLNKSEILRTNQAEFTIFFVDDIHQELNKESLNMTNKIITHSPRFLLKNPKYKKKAWDDLQEVIRFFNKK